MRKNTGRMLRPRRVVAAGGLLLAGCLMGAAGSPDDRETERLPPADRDGTVALEGLLQARLSLRAYAPDPLTRAEVGQLLWAAGGITQEKRFAHRTTPSAGALYPLEFYVVEHGGLARYNPVEHALETIGTGDRRAALAAAALGQRCVAEAPLVIVIAAEPARTTGKYGERGRRYVMMEAGFACQNILLQATALGMGGVPVGAFRDEQVTEVLELPPAWEPMLIVPLGRPIEQE